MDDGWSANGLDGWYRKLFVSVKCESFANEWRRGWWSIHKNWPVVVVNVEVAPPNSLSSNSTSDKDDEDDDEHGTGQESSSWQNLNREKYFIEINNKK